MGHTAFQFYAKTCCFVQPEPTFFVVRLNGWIDPIYCDRSHWPGLAMVIDALFLTMMIDV